MIKWFRKWMGMCDHNYEVIHQDNAVSVERCKTCFDIVKYGN